MAQIELNTLAPDFELPDYLGNLVQLSKLIGNSSVLLVFNRGFF